VTCVFTSGVTVSSTGAKTPYKQMTTATSGVLAMFPLLLPIRNLVLGTVTLVSYGPHPPVTKFEQDHGHGRNKARTRAKL